MIEKNLNYFIKILYILYIFLPLVLIVQIPGQFMTIEVSTVMYFFGIISIPLLIILLLVIKIFLKFNANYYEIVTVLIWFLVLSIGGRILLRDIFFIMPIWAILSVYHGYFIIPFIISLRSKKLNKY